MNKIIKLKIKIARRTIGAKDNKFVKFCIFYILFVKQTCNLQSMCQGILILTCAMTMVCLGSEHHSHLKCTWKHCRLLFVSMYGAVSFLRLFDNLSLKLGNLHVNQWIYCHFHSEWCRSPKSTKRMKSYENFQTASLTIFK